MALNMIMYNKLIRRNMPMIIRQDGYTPVLANARETEGLFKQMLIAKALEEMAEYTASGDPSELADLLEVVYCLADEMHGITAEQLNEMRVCKYLDRGTFDGTILVSIAPTPER
jgi:predicted house-cleaning noncanonical NTP pyrophosphatase (MazG superfamily)